MFVFCLRNEKEFLFFKQMCFVCLKSAQYILQLEQQLQGETHRFRKYGTVDVFSY